MPRKMPKNVIQHFSSFPLAYFVFVIAGKFLVANQTHNQLPSTFSSDFMLPRLPSTNLRLFDAFEQFEHETAKMFESLLALKKNINQ